MSCIICESNDWEYLDYLRDVNLWKVKNLIGIDDKLGFKICKKCGFVTYDEFNNDRLKQAYNLSREYITAQKVIEANVKNLRHELFLGNVISQIRGKGGKVLDYGCAQGAFIKHLRDKYDFDKNDLDGVDIIESNRQYAYREYGIVVKEQMPNKKYDLICLYKVLEHLTNANETMEVLLKALNDDGYMYISLPLYFEELSDIGFGTCDNFENLFHPFHNNLFSKENIINFFNKHGLKIIKEDTRIYDYTILCQKCEKKEYTLGNDYNEIIDIIKKQKEAISNVYHNPEQALKIWPKYPDAYISLSMFKENFKSFELQDYTLRMGMLACPNSNKLKLQLAKLYLQWDENKKGKKFYSNNIAFSEKLLRELTFEDVSDEVYFVLHIIEGKYKKNKKAARQCLEKVLEINPSRYTEIMQFIGALWKPED